MRLTCKWKFDSNSMSHHNTEGSHARPLLGVVWRDFRLFGEFLSSNNRFTRPVHRVLGFSFLFSSHGSVLRGLILHVGIDAVKFRLTGKSHLTYNY